ncbi:MAG: hypothetical protein E6G64_10210, partial [Actinobacteria bacterium]
MLKALPVVILAAAFFIGLHPNSSTAKAQKPCKRHQTSAVIAGRHMCLFVGKRCASAQDGLYHRYRYHCVDGRLARSHPIVPSEHTIGVRQVNGVEELYNRST